MRVTISVFFLLCFEIISAQEYGIQWLLGYNESVLDFRNDTLINYPIGAFMPIFLTNANICDSSGNLLYYTNGIYIAGKNGVALKNGDSLSPCTHSDDNRCCGLDIPQGVLFLPMPGNSRYYYLFHMSDDTFGGYRPGTLYYSIIDEQGNGGKGAVIEKNTIYYKGIFKDGGMTACKHANGRDWWIVMSDLNDTYYKFLLTPNGIADTLVQSIGPSYKNDVNVPYCKFSRDGSKYVTSVIQGPILIMDFDRCSGEFSNPDTLFNEACLPPSSCNGASSIEFSPNGRFLYVTNTLVLNQYDLSSATPQQDSIAIHIDSDTDVIKTGFLQLAPNGKLYASCYNGGYYFIHAVNSPDLKGDSCIYVDTAFTTLTAASNNFPNMVNYNLGSLRGSGCDTIFTDIRTESQEARLLRVLPNPADKYFYVEMGMQGNYEVDLLNVTGQIMDKKETRQVDIFDTGHLASGVYFLRAIDKTTDKEFTRKVVVQH